MTYAIDSVAEPYPNGVLRIYYQEEHRKVGVEWVMNNGPEDQCVKCNCLLFHKVDPSPLKCVLHLTIPELEVELAHVVNAFDPWARDRGDYYDLQ